MDLPSKIGRYRILESLGQGASGFVLKVEQDLIGRILAMKVLFAHLLQSRPLIIRRFKREARLASSLVHPNIVPIFEIGEANGLYYYTMQYIEGKPMTKYVKDESISLRQKLDICIELCDALALAHRRNIIHRDLKPHNVIITKELRPVILDFGIAKSLIEEEHMTQSGHILGSAHYMAPEQAGPGDVGTYTDIFGLGVMIYELIVGDRPFQGNNVTQLIYERIRYREDPDAYRPFRMREVDATIPEELDRIVFRCLEANPQARYASANELLEELRLFSREMALSNALQKGDRQRYTAFLPVNRRKSYHLPAVLAGILCLLCFFVGFWARKKAPESSGLASRVKSVQNSGAEWLRGCLKIRAK